jgi:hypothetical protein
MLIRSNPHLQKQKWLDQYSTFNRERRLVMDIRKPKGDMESHGSLLGNPYLPAAVVLAIANFYGCNGSGATNEAPKLDPKSEAAFISYLAQNYPEIDRMDDENLLAQRLTEILTQDKGLLALVQNQDTTHSGVMEALNLRPNAVAEAILNDSAFIELGPEFAADFYGEVVVSLKDKDGSSGSGQTVNVTLDSNNRISVADVLSQLGYTAEDIDELTISLPGGIAFIYYGEHTSNANLLQTSQDGNLVFGAQTNAPTRISESAEVDFEIMSVRSLGVKEVLPASFRSGPVELATNIQNAVTFDDTVTISDDALSIVDANGNPISGIFYDHSTDAVILSEGITYTGMIYLMFDNKAVQSEPKPLMEIAEVSEQIITLNVPEGGKEGTIASFVVNASELLSAQSGPFTAKLSIGSNTKNYSANLIPGQPLVLDARLPLESGSHTVYLTIVDSDGHQLYLTTEEVDVVNNPAPVFSISGVPDLVSPTDTITPSYLLETDSETTVESALFEIVDSDGNTIYSGSAGETFSPEIDIPGNQEQFLTIRFTVTNQAGEEGVEEIIFEIDHDGDNVVADLDDRTPEEAVASRSFNPETGLADPVLTFSLDDADIDRLTVNEREYAYVTLAIEGVEPGREFGEHGENAGVLYLELDGSYSEFRVQIQDENGQWRDIQDNRRDSINILQFFPNGISNNSLNVRVYKQYDDDIVSDRDLLVTGFYRKDHGQDDRKASDDLDLREIDSDHYTSPEPPEPTPENTAPVFESATYNNGTQLEGATFFPGESPVVTFGFSDADSNDTLTYSATLNGEAVQVTIGSDGQPTVNLTLPNVAEEESFNLTLTANDGNPNGTTSETINFTVEPEVVIEPPEVVSENRINIFNQFPAPGDSGLGYEFSLSNPENVVQVVAQEIMIGGETVTPQVIDEEDGNYTITFDIPIFANISNPQDVRLAVSIMYQGSDSAITYTFDAITVYPEQEVITSSFEGGDTKIEVTDTTTLVFKLDGDNLEGLTFEPIDTEGYYIEFTPNPNGQLTVKITPREVGTFPFGLSILDQWGRTVGTVALENDRPIEITPEVVVQPPSVENDSVERLDSIEMPVSGDRVGHQFSLANFNGSASDITATVNGIAATATVTGPINGKYNVSFEIPEGLTNLTTAIVTIEISSTGGEPITHAFDAIDIYPDVLEINAKKVLDKTSNTLIIDGDPGKITYNLSPAPESEPLLSEIDTGGDFSVSIQSYDPNTGELVLSARPIRQNPNATLSAKIVDQWGRGQVVLDWNGEVVDDPFAF